MRRLGFVICIGLLAGCGASTADSIPTTIQAPRTAEAPTASTAQAAASPTMIAPQTGTLEQQAVAALAQHLAVAPDQIQVRQSTPQQWPSRALGCPAPGMSYASELVSGFLLTVAVEGRSYQLHTDDANTFVLCENGLPIDLISNQEVPTVGANSNGERVVALHAAAKNVDPSTITIISDEEVEWPSSALGCEKPGIMYMTVMKSGFRVVIEQGGQRFNYHAGENGDFFLCEQGKK